MEKINVAELLRNCPKGMEFDCLLCNSPIALEDVLGNEHTYPIRAVGKDGFHHVLTKYGTSYNHDDAKCVIFPKGKTTWEGFVPPCQFKEGDIITCKNFACTFTSIFKDKLTEKSFQKHCSVILDDNEFIVGINHADYANPRFATEEEKTKLFKAIKDNGYKWNEETKTLEKLPKFKVGDRIKQIGSPRCYIIQSIEFDRYILHNNQFLRFGDEHIYELVPNKFDLNTLVPFESRVLVRGDKSSYWEPAIFGCYLKNMIIPYYALGGTCWQQCIPYENNEHLLGTTDDCDKYFKTWE